MTIILKLFFIVDIFSLNSFSKNQVNLAVLKGFGFKLISLGFLPVGLDRILFIRSRIFVSPKFTARQPGTVKPT